MWMAIKYCADIKGEDGKASNLVEIGKYDFEKALWKSDWGISDETSYHFAAQKDTDTAIRMKGKTFTVFTASAF